ncbi:hypothetical protein [Cypionkella sp.]|uniref:hypothetical protein n=1 Tax=Cypionkella sp. TaxID=2811411 RepID=UPI002614B5AF|nr:hypothetical protein [Cypionkella sp.]MDB5666834.1 hypothetical protein [Cypionkella sp.]
MIRHLLSALLALTLATTSVHAAVMHSEMQGAVQMEICADTSAGLTTVTLDATGKPIPTAHRCPDCTIAPASLLPHQPQISRPVTRSIAKRQYAVATHTAAAPPNQSARDPPLPI